VVVPAYNEEARLGASLDALVRYLDSRGSSYELLVVDDGSTDATRQIADRCAAGHPTVSILAYGDNRGKGHAVRFGMLRATGDRILFSDADLATPIEELEKLSAALDEGYDIAIGSRDIKGSQLVKRQNPIRELGGKAFNRAVQMLAVPGIRDTQCGFKLFTKKAAQDVFNRCRVDNFSFDVEALFVARLLKLKVHEVPVRWAHQEGSKVRFLRDGIRMLRTLFQIRSARYDRTTPPVSVSTSSLPIAESAPTEEPPVGARS
jgi:dolichyl-phosphate beta-glucosyltransferase